jgi:hypothetical protein
MALTTGKKNDSKNGNKRITSELFRDSKYMATELAKAHPLFKASRVWISPQRGLNIFTLGENNIFR